MRFQRHAKIFRGQLDPAPVAGVFFLLTIFVILGYQLYTPGVLVELNGKEATTDSTLVVTRTNTVVFEGKTYQTNEFAQLRDEIRNLSSDEPLALKMNPGASSKLREQVRELMFVSPPVMTEGLIGTDNPVVIVAVNLRGQFFYENQMVQEQELKVLLQDHLRAAAKLSKSLTLVLLQDNGVPAKTFVRVTALAKKVGIKEVIIGTRPGTFSKGTVSHAP